MEGKISNFSLHDKKLVKKDYDLWAKKGLYVESENDIRVNGRRGDMLLLTNRKGLSIL